MAEQQALMAIEREELQAPTPMDLLKIAMSQNADIEKLDRLMQLQERWLAGEARKAFAGAYVQMKARLPKVLRTKDNTQTKSKYAPLEEINQAIDPTLQAYGFSTATKIIRQDENSVTVRAELWHSGGHVEGTEITMPLDKTGIGGTVNKTGPWALSSSVTYAKRIAVCALLNISTGDDLDGNGASGTNLDDLSERLEFIANCRNPEELKRIYAIHYKAAAAAKSKRAMTSIKEAYDAKKQEFAA